VVRLSKEQPQRAACARLVPTGTSITPASGLIRLTRHAMWVRSRPGYLQGWQPNCEQVLPLPRDPARQAQRPNTRTTVTFDVHRRHAKLACLRLGQVLCHSTSIRAWAYQDGRNARHSLASNIASPHILSADLAVLLWNSSAEDEEKVNHAR